MAKKEAQSDQDRIVIRKPNLELIEVTIEGVTPLLCHRYGPRAVQKQLESQMSTTKKAKEPRDPEAEYLDSLYTLEGREGYWFPAGSIKNAMVDAARVTTTTPMTEIRRVIAVRAAYVQINGDGPYRHEATARLPNGAGDPRFRGVFKEGWRMKVPIVYLSTMISEEDVLSLLESAGFTEGLGDWRNSCKGSYGQFVVVSSEKKALSQ